MRKLQRYTVNLRRNEALPLLNQGDIEEIMPGLFVQVSDWLYDSSLGGTIYEYRLKNGQKGSFRLKDFSSIYLPFMCNDCILKGTSKCRERFYGIRVQHGYVRLCIDRHDEKVLYDYENFLANKNAVLTQLKRQYRVS